MNLEKLAMLLCFMPRGLFEERKKGKEEGRITGSTEEKERI